ncbi:MAG: XrtA-associated ATPase [Desulfuromonadaceae bacterium]|nr:XrtA-associated ATPase [Desulfuromonadaceae bacterium]MDD5104842.1 XrtA-associated ATPase [Desulfuromonadaceae bacterium]
MYESFFKLTVKPFDLLPDPRFIYLSKSHRKALTYLDYGIRERSGFVLLTGEIGSGKTTLIRDLLEKHYEQVVLSKIFNTRVTSEQLLAMINDDFGLAVQGKDKVTLIRDLNEFLITQYAAGNQPILIIDEAQNLSSELLEEVRMLSNLEASTSKLLQIILVGQPELREILAAPGLRQLRQRISINCHLLALNREELELYILHRLDVAGNVDAVQFLPESLDIIYRYSRGIPRLVNIICDFLLFLAFAEETTELSPDMVRDVIGDLDFENYHWMEGLSTGLQDSPQPDEHASPLATAASLDLHTMIVDIGRRLESVEQNITNRLNEGLKDQNDRLVTFQTSVQAQVAKNSSSIQVLDKKLEELKKNATIHPSDTPLEEPKIGFVRRVFGGDSYPNSK